MTKLKKTFLAATLAIPLMAAASDFPWLTFRMNDDTEISVSSENLDMNYKEGILHLSSANVNQSIPVDKIKSMRFTSHSAGINDIEASDSENSEYYNLSGIMVGKFKTAEDAKKTLPSGVYIVRNSTKTYKVTF